MLESSVTYLGSLLVSDAGGNGVQAINFMKSVCSPVSVVLKCICLRTPITADPKDVHDVNIYRHLPY